MCVCVSVCIRLRGCYHLSRQYVDHKVDKENYENVFCVSAKQRPPEPLVFWLPTCQPSRFIWHYYYITWGLREIYRGSQHPRIAISGIMAALCAFQRGKRY